LLNVVGMLILSTINSVQVSNETQSTDPNSASTSLSTQVDWLIKVLRPIWRTTGHFTANLLSWLSIEDLNLTQRKQTRIRDKIYYNIRRKQTKARFGRLLRSPAWKHWNGPILKEVYTEESK